MSRPESPADDPSAGLVGLAPPATLGATRTRWAEPEARISRLAGLGSTTLPRMRTGLGSHSVGEVNSGEVRKQRRDQPVGRRGVRVPGRLFDETRWQSGLIDSRITSDGPLAVGSTGRDIRKSMGMKSTTQWVVTELVPNELFAFNVTKPVPFEVSYRISSRPLPA